MVINMTQNIYQLMLN